MLVVGRSVVVFMLAQGGGTLASRSVGYLTLVAALSVWAPSASAQETTVLTEDFCTACLIELTPDVLLGADGESVIGVAMDIERLSDGRFVMTFAAARYEFTIFSADGADFQRVGRAGEGPGEYEE